MMVVRACMSVLVSMPRSDRRLLLIVATTSSSMSAVLLGTTHSASLFRAACAARHTPSSTSISNTNCPDKSSHRKPALHAGSLGLSHIASTDALSKTQKGVWAQVASLIICISCTVKARLLLSSTSAS